MTRFRFDCNWLSVGQDDAVFRETTAQLGLHVGDTCLTRHEDVWSKTVRDSVLVSAYPLAMWFAASWWRLGWEPLPRVGMRPALDWRMAHEMGAANHGFVWPKVLFASDGEHIGIWAEAAYMPGQSVNYLAGLDVPCSVSLSEFQQDVEGFITAVLSRLRAVGCNGTDLEKLWQCVLDDRADPDSACVRQLEAQLGFDPEECPQEILEHARRLQSQTGVAAMSELAPVFGRRDDGVALDEINKLVEADGLIGQMQVDASTIVMGAGGAPWRRGVEAAKNLRRYLDNTNRPIDDKVLLGLLGLTQPQVDTWAPPSRLRVTVAIPDRQGLKFVPRKRHPVAKRFEFARLLGSCLYECVGSENWLTSTDLATSRQKYQRAFAAELLCPIESLVDFLEDDFSEAAVEEAVEHFGVSEQTVESLLMNNGYLERSYEGSSMPYHMAA